MTDQNGTADPSLVQVVWSKRFLDTSINYVARAISDPSKVADPVAFTFGAVNWKPLQVDPIVVKGSDGAGGYYVRFFGRSRYPDSSLDDADAGLPYTWADPLSFTIRLIDGVTILDERIVTSTTSEITAHYTDVELIALYGAVPDTLTGEIFQNGTWVPGMVREFTGI